MGKFEKRKRMKQQVSGWMIIASLAFLLFITIVIYKEIKEEAYAKNSYHVNETTTSDVNIQAEIMPPMDVIETENSMVIKTKYFEFEIPNTFAEILDISYADYYNYFALEFNMKGSEKNIPLYTIWIGRKSDMVLGRLINDTDENKLVSAEFYDMPKDMTGGAQETFFAAQETANDVIQAISSYLVPVDADALSEISISPEVDDDTKENILPEDNIAVEFQVVENTDTMDIITEYGTASYPIAFEELLVVIPKISDIGYSLEFYCVINQTRIPVYTMGFDTSVGTEIGHIVYEQDSEVLVSIEYLEAPPDLIGGELDAFFAAQETANDVISSLNLKT